MQPDKSLIARIVDTASDVWRVSPNVIRGRNRTEAVLKARYAVYHCLVCNLGLSLEEAGVILKRSHGAIGNGIRQLDSWKSSYPAVNRQFQEFSRRIMTTISESLPDLPT